MGGRTCVFCTNDIPDDDPPEHVVPQWVSDELLKLPGEDLFRITFSDPTIPPFEGRIIEMTIESVCRNCNHGWMSNLESRVAPLLRPAISGAFNQPDVRLTADRHPTIAAWAAKTAMTLDRWYAEHGAQSFIPSGHYADLCASKNVRHATHVWIGGYGFLPDAQTFRHAWCGRAGFTMELPDRGTHYQGYAVTFQYGYLTVQTICIDGNEDVFDTLSGVSITSQDGTSVPPDDFALRIWPTKGTVTWPPTFSLEAAGLEHWALRPPWFS